MAWFARERGQASLLYLEMPKLEIFLEKEFKADKGSDRFFPLALLWLDPADSMEAPSATSWVGEGPVPVAFHRSGWEPFATFIAIKGGSPDESHAHMDIGTFVVDMGCERWVTDLGSQSYNPMEQAGLNIWDFGQNSDRWKVFRHHNGSHSTLVVDGARQRVDGHAPLVRSSDGLTQIDMSPVYRDQLAEANRTVELVREGRVEILDQIKAGDREAQVRWAIMTPAEVQLESPTRAILTRNGKRVFLDLHQPANGAWQLYEAAAPPEDWDEPNPGHHLVGFEIQLPAGGTVECRVGMTLEGAPTNQDAE